MLNAYEQHLTLPAAADGSPLEHFAEQVKRNLPGESQPIRFVVSESSKNRHVCELGVLDGLPAGRDVPSIFEFRRRGSENPGAFNAVLLVPTGIGCAVGGHAGDANPVANLLAPLCDTLITHPNVVNASDIMELPGNGLYVEGSVISRLLMGTCGIQPVRANRILTVVDEHADTIFTNAAINSVSAARASYGADCPLVVRMDPPIGVSAGFSESGRAVGRVEYLERLLDVLDEFRGQYDAVALSTQIRLQEGMQVGYYEARGDVINPWGGVEALLTHSLSLLTGLPTAHSPMFTRREHLLAELSLDPVEPRMAAEIISYAFLMCVLKGLQRSPRVVEADDLAGAPGALTASDVSVLVIPDGCIGLPTLAALEQGIPVIAVRENSNLMRNDLTTLPWAPGQLHLVENYWEAVGVMTALRAGISPASVRRPLAETVQVTRRSSTLETEAAAPRRVRRSSAA